MKLLVTGACGFVGSALIQALIAARPGLEVVGLDNLVRPGSETNRLPLRRRGVRVVHGDVRLASDFEQLPKVDWVIDAAANPSALAGVDGRSSSRQVLEHNLAGTVNLLEYCRATGAGLILLSTSRVFSIPALAALPMRADGDAFVPDLQEPPPVGAGVDGIREAFPTTPPISLYGATKLASECLALEYGATFSFPVWIDRCGVLAGAGQFGTAEQGVFSFWVHAHAARRPLRYLGFGGSGRQVRDALHPDDLARLVDRQIAHPEACAERIVNVGGGRANAVSLARLHAWCDARFGRHEVAADPTPRRFDVPWLVMDPGRAAAVFGWRPERSLESILDEIARHAAAHPDWLERTEA